MSEKINTYVIFDLETTSLPSYESNLSKIIELSMIAVNTTQFCDNKIPRVQHKLTLCIQPNRIIKSTIHGLYNDLLENEQPFNESTFKTIDEFLKRLKKPICLIAHNGNRFDFPLLQQHLFNIGKNFAEEIYCADSYLGFKNIIKYNKYLNQVNQFTNQSNQEESTMNNIPKTAGSISQSCQIESDVQSQPDIVWGSQGLNTPKQNKINQQKLNLSLKRKQPFDNKNKDINHAKKRLFPELSNPSGFSLGKIYEYLTNKKPINSHNAEADCIMLLECIASISNPFYEWVNINKVLFNSIERYY